MKVKSPLTKTEVKQSQYAFRDELSLFEKALNPSQKQLSLFKKCPSALEKIVLHFYNPQNEMFRLLGTKRSFSQNETFFFSHPYPPTLPFSA